MSSSGVDPVYVAARRILLDALDVLQPHFESIRLVGAQAVYLHTHAADLAVQPYTADGDIAVEPGTLRDEPKLAAAMVSAGFAQVGQPGTWQKSAGEVVIPVDLLVPEALGGGGRRSADVGDHGDGTARKAKGIEAALVDDERMMIMSLEPELDLRSFTVRVAGPAALLVAKMHKLNDRLKEAKPARVKSKDALDVLRILQAIDTERLRVGLAKLRQTGLSSETTNEALEIFTDLFTTERGVGIRLVGEAVEGAEDPATARASALVLARRLTDAS